MITIASCYFLLNEKALTVIFSPRIYFCFFFGIAHTGQASLFPFKDVYSFPSSFEIQPSSVCVCIFAFVFRLVKGINIFESGEFLTPSVKIYWMKNNR
jgi:hypothetical protein